MVQNASKRNIPRHVHDAVRTVAELRSEHHGNAGASQKAANRITALLATPLAIGLLGVAVAGWIAANLIAMATGAHPIDPPPFPWLQGGAELFSVFIVMLILVSQKHEDELNSHRDTLTLELAILSEQKLAKLIQLLEELRRDSPQVQDRVDAQADQMGQHADAQSVLAATRAQPAS